MPVVRSNILEDIENVFSQATLDWHYEDEYTGLDWYLIKHGIFHLLDQECIGDAKQRMLDVYFMASFAEVYDTEVEPLKAFRIVGVEGMRQSFLDVVERLPDPSESTVETARVYGSVSQFLCLSGLYDAGLPFAQRRYSVCCEMLSFEHPNTLSSMNNLGMLYEAQGRYDEAEPLYLRTLEARERTLGLEHPDTLMSLSNLGALYESQGRYDEAEPLYLYVVEAKKRTLGLDHSYTLTSLNNLGLLYKLQGRYDEAEPLYLRTLEARERTLGLEHPDTLSSLNNLAVLYCAQGRYDEAEPLHLRDLEAVTRTLGPEHPDTLVSLNALGLLYKLQGRYDEAEPLYLRTLEAKERTLGLDHPYTLTSLHNLGWLYLEQHTTKGHECFVRVLIGWKDPADWKHHWAKLGLALSDGLISGEFTPVESVLKGLIDLLGPDHARVAKAQVRINHIRSQQSS